jgi:hypothetical protein
MGALAVVLVIAGIVAWVLFSRPTVTELSPDVSFPASTTTTPGTGGEVTATMTIPARDGTPVTVLDFTKRNTTIEDVQNSGILYLAGSPEYCLIDGGCPEGAEVDAVNIIYNANDKSFTTALLDEPLSEVRRRAERFLLTTLGIGEIELCTLDYYVGTDRGVSENYAGRNLGFSFCPGSTELP